MPPSKVSIISNNLFSSAFVLPIIGFIYGDDFINIKVLMLSSNYKTISSIEFIIWISLYLVVPIFISFMLSIISIYFFSKAYYFSTLLEKSSTSNDYFKNPRSIK